MGHTVRHYGYHKCCEPHCEYCAANKQHQANIELQRTLDELDYYNEYKNKLIDTKKEEDNE